MTWIRNRRFIGSVRTEMMVQLQPLIPIKHIELKMKVVPERN